jgi:hypothetical protein
MFLVSLQGATLCVTHYLYCGLYFYCEHIPILGVNTYLFIILNISLLIVNMLDSIILLR